MIATKSKWLAWLLVSLDQHTASLAMLGSAIDNPIASTNTLAFLAVAPAVMKEAARAAAADESATPGCLPRRDAAH